MKEKRSKGKRGALPSRKPKGRAASDDYTRTGSAMGVLGGGLLLVTLLLAWVEIEEESWDVFALIEHDLTYWLLLLGLVLGGAVLALSFVLYRSGNWLRSKQFVWGAVALVLSSYILAVLVLSLLLIQADLNGTEGSFRYGAAPFLALFGAMLCLAGSALFVLDRQGALGPAPARSWPEGGHRSRPYPGQKRAACPVQCPNCGAMGYAGGSCTACGMDLEEEGDQDED